MKIINRSRQGGKTTILIHTAYATDKPIIVSSQERKQNILEMAEKMKTPVEVYSNEEWCELKHFHRPMSILIDDVQDFLYPILFEHFNVEIDAVTMSIPMDNVKDLENLGCKHGKWEKFVYRDTKGACCSVCREKIFAKVLQSKYCPNCGAKMDGAED